MDAEGNITLAEDGLLTQVVEGAAMTLPTRMQWRSFPDQILQAELFFVHGEAAVYEAHLVEENNAYSLLEEDGVTSLLKNSGVLARVRADGQIELLDPSLYLIVNAANQGLSLAVMENGQAVLQVNYERVWEEDVTLLESDHDLTDWSSLNAGIYIKPTADNEHAFEPISSGNSSLSPQGLALVDPTEELPKEMQASLGYTSLDQAEEDGTVGWEKENKNLLLFSAGNTAGVSNLFYVSEVGILLGDPTVSLPTANEANSLGFTEDVGTLISASQDEILELVDIDYNGDGQMDVLVAYEDGRIEVLQNHQAAQRLRSRGTLLKIENGIRSIDKGDFNADGLTDLLIVTEESCYADEMCLYEYDNIGGGFVAKNLSFSDIAAQPEQVEVSDLNNDGYDDLVLADENMVLYTVWNSAGGFYAVDEIKDFGLHSDSSIDLASQMLLRYSGLDSGSVSLPITVDARDTGNAQLDRFLNAVDTASAFTLETDGENGGGLEQKADTLFEHANAEVFNDVFSVSKSMSDENGGTAEVGDELTYTLTLQNISGTTLNNIYISDTVDAVFQFNAESLTCSDCSAVNLSEAQFVPADATRPFVFGPLDLANGADLTLTYHAELMHLPQLALMVGNDLFGDYVDDDRPDIGVSLDGNTTGELMVYYSDGSYTETLEEGILGSDLGAMTVEHVHYAERNYSPSTYAEEHETERASPFEDADEDGVPDFMGEMDPELGIPVPDSGYDAVAEVLGGSDQDGNGYYSSQEMFSSDVDADNDGLYDTIDRSNAGEGLILDPALDLLVGEGAEIDAEVALLDEQISGLTNQVEEVVSSFTCDGGCLALPGSVAFLASGTFHDPFTGTPLGYDVGTPVFGIMPNPSYVCTATACQATSVLRIYIAPTTTLGLGLGVCVAPYAVGQCYAFNIPLLQALGVCDAINGFVADSLSKASDFVEENGTVALNVLGSSGGTVAAPSGLSSSSYANYSPPLSTQTNIDIPGFPSVFTEWWKAQKMEFFKMLDLPDITFIYPDPKSLSSEFGGIRQRAQEESVSLDQASNPMVLDHEIKIQEMSSGILNLDKWLNMAHALPIIDIQTEKVYIHYPALTEEEVEIFQKDMGEWTVRTKSNFAIFKEQFELRRLAGEEISAAEEQAYDELVLAVDEAITAVESNMAILESYKDIPEQILEIRTMQAQYAKVIVCYLDAILDYTAGYLSENLQRVEAWAQFVVDLRDVVDGWQVLIDLSADFMDSCDKCTNQRYSGLQLLFSLFVFMPEFPVVELPKLPDIVIDVSHIQAGVDILWPDIEFVPERIDIPELPELVFPSARFNLDTELDIDLDIPTLPEFQLNFELPQLPALTLPELPSLPPPPSIPELDPTLKASLEVASNVLKLVCIIRSGFIPTPESQLKARIEEITERPGGTFVAADFASTVEWPAFNYDFLKRIEINTYLNLNADFTPLFDVMEHLGAQTEELSENTAEGISGPLQDLANEIQEALTGAGENTSIDIDAELNVDLESYVHPAVQTAELYKDDPLVQQNLIALQQVMHSLQSQIDAWAKDLPEEVRLEATDRLLALDDPLLNRYDEIAKENPNLDPEFLASIQETPLVGVLNLKNSLLAHVQNLDAENTRLLVMDDENFFRTLAAESSSSHFELAATQEEGYSTAAEWNLNALKKTSLDEVELSTESGAPEIESLDLEVQNQAFNTGLYIYNAEADVSTRLTAYAAETDETTHILFMDVDQDGDEDVIYSLGGDVYIKENHNESPRLQYVSTDPSEVTLSEELPAAGSMQKFEEKKNTHGESSFAFGASYEAVGYEFTMYDSLDAQEAAPNENVKRLLLLSEEENLKGVWSSEGDFTAETSGNPAMPSVAMSRLVATAVSGNVQLKNGAARTFIHDNAEWETSEPVLLQTVSPAVLELTYEESEARLEVPAYTVLSFGNDVGRRIRLESGEAYMIDPDTFLTEQDLEEGMMIFAGEIVDLETSNAEATLSTTEGGVFHLDEEEVFVMDRLLSPESPSAQVQLENGAYYTVGRALYGDGNSSTLSDNILLNPQICGDDSEPMIISPDRLDLAIFSTTDISADQSFDSTSEIIDAYWDLDANVDADGDGEFTNDEERFGLNTSIGPYTDLEPKTVTLHVVDSAGNIARRSIEVNLYVPAIEVHTATPEVVAGGTDPSSPHFPFTLVREREGTLKELGAYMTDEDGNFILPMQNSDLLAVYNAEGLSIAEFNPLTKQVQILDEDYEVRFITASETWPSHLAVYEKSTGIVMGNFIFVTDSSLPITRLGTPLSDYDLSTLNRVTVHSVNDPNGYDFANTSITAYDELGNLDFKLSNTGNITVFDSRYTVLRREADSLEDPLILEVYDEGTLELEIWPGMDSTVYLETTDDLNLPASALIENHGSSTQDTELYFEDIDADDPLYEKITELVQRNVLEGYEVDGDRYFKPDNQINRAEFTKIILSILCIVPRDEAEILPAVFNDILNESSWYYPYTKESYLSGLITGYLGEKDATGLTPFKPENTITRAEASKIVLEALNAEGVIRLPDLQSDGAWYEPYMEIAQDLSPYMTGESTAGTSNHLLTAEEAALPNHVLTRYEFVEMSVRVLQAYNCFALETPSDYFNDETEWLPGIHALREACNTCPCVSQVDYAAELRPGDFVFAIIQNEWGEIFGVSPSVEILAPSSP
ncbi:S-layer homology domain-containing protein [Candidatus Peregrinibacteria bacterium]|nr:MAG: S-layer homology domain-containing protein [Candidatus Peregrinibacteria bacterium]